MKKVVEHAILIGLPSDRTAPLMMVKVDAYTTSKALQKNGPGKNIKNTILPQKKVKVVGVLETSGQACSHIFISYFSFFDFYGVTLDQRWWI